MDDVDARLRRLFEGCANELLPANGSPQCREALRAGAIGVLVNPVDQKPKVPVFWDVYKQMLPP